MNKCYYVHCPLPCGEQKRGHICRIPWRRKGYKAPLTLFIYRQDGYAVVPENRLGEALEALKPILQKA
jgi:hypothetical protein